ncbi:hypothetical protein [Acinetobacter radioresistens]|uniref:hypothetical protein n=1 Tax=Acinetobacter radioresistens TaxID=40216 RepID=UPI0009464EF5|nr:hypothetical protein [Acinetobacter radioresistens]
MSNSHINAIDIEKIVEAKPSTRFKKKVQPKIVAYRLMIFYRFMLAAVGGYALASFAAMLIAQYFSDYQSNAAISATMIGFLLQTAAFIWVFIVNKTLKATLGILVPAMLFYIAYQFLEK